MLIPFFFDAAQDQFYLFVGIAASIAGIYFCPFRCSQGDEIPEAGHVALTVGSYVDQPNQGKSNGGAVPSSATPGRLPGTCYYVQVSRTERVARGNSNGGVTDCREEICLLEWGPQSSPRVRAGTLVRVVSKVALQAYQAPIMFTCSSLQPAALCPRMYYKPLHTATGM